MVYITAADGVEKKYACIKCIKGHRSSKCTHRERELFEIKRKGRPVSQCENCRYLRKTKQVHIKCMCHFNKTEDSNMPVIDQGFRYVELPPVNEQSSCSKCDRPTLYCLCQIEEIKQEPQSDSESSPIISQDITTTGSTVTPISSVPASPSGTASPIINKPVNRHLAIPIHDPSDDIDSDTPIYKSVEDNDDDTKQVFTSKSSDELMNQIYSGFDPANSSTTSPLLLKEDDGQLIEISNDP